MSDADLNPPLVGEVPATFDPDAPATASGRSGRFTPSRPISPAGETLVSTPAATPEEKIPAETYTVKRGDNLWSLAKKNGLTVRQLASANGLPADAGLRVGQVLLIPGRTVASPTASGTAAGGATAPAKPSRTYQIQPGDTLGKIARRHGTTVAELKAFNRLTSDMVRAGDTLAIPESADVPPPATTTPASPATTDTTAAAATTPSTYRHTVAPGESLTVIASRYGVRVGDIALANKIRDPSLIRPGQQLLIPGWEAPEVTAEPDETVATITTAEPAAADDDLDAGLDDEDLSNVPVITVEDEVKTIESDDAGSPPVFE
jgi:LysM repeat protein